MQSDLQMSSNTSKRANSAKFKYKLNKHELEQIRYADTKKKENINIWIKSKKVVGRR